MSRSFWSGFSMLDPTDYDRLAQIPVGPPKSEWRGTAPNASEKARLALRRQALKQQDLLKGVVGVTSRYRRAMLELKRNSSYTPPPPQDGRTQKRLENARYRSWMRKIREEHQARVAAETARREAEAAANAAWRAAHPNEYQITLDGQEITYTAEPGNVAQGLADALNTHSRCRATVQGNTVQIEPPGPYFPFRRAPTFVKHDQGKPSFSLIPPRALEEEARVLTQGAAKYTRENWRLLPKEDQYRYLDAAFRHLNAYQRGEVSDPESGRHHLAHARCCLGFLLELELEERHHEPRETP